MFDVEEIRKDFPILGKEINGKKLIYFDNAATTQKPREVIEGIKFFYENINANPIRSLHYLAEKATEAYNEARKKVAEFINASPEEIVFVRNATEGINLVSFAVPFKKGDSIVTSYLEHHSNILPWLRLKEEGINVEFADVDENYDLKMEIYENLPENTKLVTVTHESNVSGTINDVEKISNLVHKKGALFLVDLAQSIPHMKIDIKKIGADFAAFSGHKMLGPFGIGVLYINKRIHNILNPFLEGGEMIKDVKLNRIEYADLPYFYEAGTQNIEGAFGLGIAIDYLNKIGMNEIENYEEKLKKHMFERIKELKKVKVFSGKSKKYGAILSFNIEGLHPHDVAYLLDKEGIAIRSGFHCAQPFIEDKLKQNGTARASLYFYNTIEEIDKFIEVLKEIERKV
ncbi:MAG: cysteine desulfurase [Candidatus Rehaiarchaeum fermentans]|nr:cysteine desulfurase [Candidatus Rehaiarchaeum fermentans]MCW1302175.1 cysteine desulfurase [Candidatus Rehaiarchaeum fermentans]